MQMAFSERSFNIEMDNEIVYSVGFSDQILNLKFHHKIIKNLENYTRGK